MNKQQDQHSDASMDLSRSSIRAQLLWASLFPLAFFGLLSTLVTASALNQMMLDLILQRNTAQVQVLADGLLQDLAGDKVLDSSQLNSTLQSLKPVAGSCLYLIDDRGELVASSQPSLTNFQFNFEELTLLIQTQKPGSQIMESTLSAEKLMVSYAPLPGKHQGVILEEPWAPIMAPAFYYQLVLVVLLAIGTALSLGMLSLSITRVVQPISTLAENATRAVPGSVFRPVSEQGPSELRILIRAFNQMVIRLAEQQSAIRQYAQKALISQEEERQRLSHELHDGTVQDLVGLAQRVELCRSEMESDPLQARLRLDELHQLVEQTLDDVRRISNALRPSILEDLGLVIALEAICKDLQYERPSVKVEYAISGEARRLQPDLELAVFRIIQEALANIRKHVEGVSLVKVSLTFSEEVITAVIKNDGRVFSDPDVRSFVRSGHLGLAGMYERARLFGGTLDITPDGEGNTVVLLILPCAEI